MKDIINGNFGNHGITIIIVFSVCSLGDYIDKIHMEWKGNYEWLERHHGYIQWLFPIRERGLNWQAQELQLHEIEVIEMNFYFLSVVLYTIFLRNRHMILPTYSALEISLHGKGSTAMYICVCASYEHTNRLSLKLCMCVHANLCRRHPQSLAALKLSLHQTGP